MINSTETLIRDDEGVEVFPYPDGRGIKTWGIGHNLVANPYLCGTALALMNQAVEAQFAFDLPAITGFLTSYAWWAALDPVRQAALQDMAFNLGETAFQNFTTFIGYMAASDWPHAVYDLRQTEVYTQLPTRYERLAQMIKTGEWPT